MWAGTLGELVKIARTSSSVTRVLHHPLQAFDRVVVRQTQDAHHVTSYHPSMTDSLRGSAPPWYTPVSGFTRIGAKPFLIPHGPTTSTWCPLVLSASMTVCERRASTCKRFG